MRGQRTRPSSLVGGWIGNGLVLESTAFESIATTTVGAGGVGTVTFSSIPDTFKHLQIRAIVRTNRTSTYDSAYIYFNSDTTRTNYTLHGLRGDGSSASSYGYASASATGIQMGAIGNSPAAGIFSPNIIDVLDYSNTNKKIYVSP